MLTQNVSQDLSASPSVRKKIGNRAAQWWEQMDDLVRIVR